MKKCYLYAGMLAAGMLAFSACSNDDDPIPSGGQENVEVAADEQVIVLDVQNTDILATKSRPLYSTENQGAERVTDVRLLIFKQGDNNIMTLVNDLSIDDWNINSDNYSYGRQYSLKLTGDDKLTEAGTYTILAVGQDESDLSASPAPYKINATGVTDPQYVADLDWNDTYGQYWVNPSEPGKGFLTTDPLKYADPDDGVKAGHLAGEIFSGTSEPITITLSGEQVKSGFTAKVLLKRQVAGVIGYFNNIPAIVANGGSANAASDYDAVKKIRLVASNRNDQLNLTYNLAVQKDDGTHESVDDEDLENVVNGFASTTLNFDAPYNGSTDDDAYIVYEIDLADWFTVNEDGATAHDATYWYKGGDFTSAPSEMPLLGNEFGTAEGPTWHNKYSSVNNGPYVATNSVLAGEFVIPFDKVADKNTFELQLVGTDANGDKVLKSWTVALQDVSEDTGDTKYIHNIYRNQLYQIGKRGGGDNPDEPGEGPDDPQPLDKNQEIMLRINDNWEIIHDMVIE